jgi:hypothetical protein
VTCLTEGRRYYATLFSLLGNRNTSMDTLTTLVLLVTIATKSRKATVGCMATNSGKASVGRIATNSGKASIFHRAVRVLYRGGSREHEPVSRRSQKGSVFEESPRSEKPVFRRVAVVG